MEENNNHENNYCFQMIFVVIK